MILKTGPPDHNPAFRLYTSCLFHKKGYGGQDLEGRRDSRGILNNSDDAREGGVRADFHWQRDDIERSQTSELLKFGEILNNVYTRTEKNAVIVEDGCRHYCVAEILVPRFSALRVAGRMTSTMVRVGTLRT